MLCELGPGALRALKGAIVVLPAVTYANVGELAIDVLVATLKPQFLGAMESVNVLPVVGNDAYDLDPSPAPQQPGRLATALELFKMPGRPLVFLQQRAPAMVGCQAAFAAELAGWLVEAGALGVMVLTGLDAQLRRDRQLDSTPLRYLASSEDLRAACVAAQLRNLPEQQQQQLLQGQERRQQDQEEEQPRLQPAVVALLELEAEIREEELQLRRSLPPWPFLRQCETQGLPYVLLGCFSAEGDNAGEGLRLAEVGIRVLASMRVPAVAETAEGEVEGGVASDGAAGALVDVPAVALRAPPSWVGLYGRSFPAEIF